MGISASAPWTAYYGNTPVSVDYPHVSMFRLLSEAAKKHPENTAYVFMGKQTSYTEFMKRIDAAAKGLYQMGIRKNITLGPKGPYSDYPKFILGKWFNVKSESYTLLTCNNAKSFNVQSTNEEHDWMNFDVTYTVSQNELTSTSEYGSFKSTIEFPDRDNLIFEKGYIYNSTTDSENVFFRVKESFDIKGSYSSQSAKVVVVPAEGKTALQLPEGVLYNGENYISVSDIQGVFANGFISEATFAEGGKLDLTVDGAIVEKGYALNGNDLTLNLYDASVAGKISATAFPNKAEDAYGKGS